ncbi:MAG: hypothetical protein ACREE3_04070 [Stellaceae bacterium]
MVGTAKLQLGRDEEAVQWLRRAIEGNRNFSIVHFFLASALAFVGRRDQAQAAVEAGLSVDPAFTIRRFHANAVAASDDPTFLAQRERIIEGMRKAGVPEG